MRWLLAIICAACFSSLAIAQDVRVADPAKPSPPARIADFAWLEGTWVGEGFGAELRETFSQAVGGQMPGHFSVVSKGKPSMYEFEMLAEVGPSLEYRVRHFNPDMTAWEEKDKFVRFPLVAVEKDVWFFDGFTLRRTGPDTAVHIVRIKRKDGTTEDAVLNYRRTKP
jgi:hypothetical protein